MWVSLTASSIDPSGNDGKPVATVTAKKLGLTKTVQTVLPKPVYDRILAAVERIKHPELHSPWYKALQDKFKGLLHPVPVTAQSPTKELADQGNKTASGSTPGVTADTEKASSTAPDRTAITTPPDGGKSAEEQSVKTKKDEGSPAELKGEALNPTSDMLEKLIP
jgi:hypothetical protein